jgi:hypothetical protein
MVDRTEQVTGFRALALVAPEPGEAGGVPQLEQPCTLPLGNSDGLTIALLGSELVAGGIQKITPHPQQLSFKNPLLIGLDNPCSLGKAPAFFVGLIELSVGFGEPGKQK